MTPHGSRVIEWLRVGANRFLTDSWRKRIKGWISDVQSIPLRLLGLQSQMDQMTEELERVKARLNHLEGEIRFRQYGSVFPALGVNSDGSPSSHS